MTPPLPPITQADAEALIRDELAPRLAQARTEAADAERRAKGLRIAVEGLAMAFPELATIPEVAEVLRPPEPPRPKRRRRRPAAS